MKRAIAIVGKQVGTTPVGATAGEGKLKLTYSFARLSAVIEPEVVNPAVQDGVVVDERVSNVVWRPDERQGGQFAR